MFGISDGSDGDMSGSLVNLGGHPDRRAAGEMQSLIRRNAQGRAKKGVERVRAARGSTL
jgi:hypothetical protein